MYDISLQVGPASFRIVSAWSEIIDQIAESYAQYPKNKLADFTVRMESKNIWRRYIRPSITIEGDYMLPDASPLPLDQGLLAAEMAMNLQMALGWHRHLILHASAVEKDGKALIMTGESGSGKSTLSAMLGQRGWRFMGDEFTLIDLNNGHAVPYPRLISLKNESIKAMEKEAPNARFGPLMKDTPKGDIRHMIPPPDAIRKMDQTAIPALLLFPSYGYEKGIRNMLPSETFMLLTQASTNFVSLGERGFDTLTQFIQNTPACGINYESGDEAVEIVEKIWKQL